jgi:hypothetical protein
MKTVKWVLGASFVVSTAVIIALTTTASAGDFVTEKEVSQVLTAGERTAMWSWVVSQWPAAPVADIDELACQNRRCRAYRTSEIPAAEYSDLVAAHRVVDEPWDIAPDGSTCKAKIVIGKRRLTNAQAASLRDTVMAVFGVPATVFSVAVKTEQVDGAEVTRGTVRYLETLSPVALLLCKRNNTCGRIQGVVQ